MDILGIAGIVIGLAVAFWQYRKAQQAESKLTAAIASVPEKVAQQVQDVISKLPVRAGVRKSTSTDLFHVQLGDVNGDSIEELIVQFPAGAHGSAIRVFSRRNERLEVIGELGSGTPAPVELSDVDADGITELILRETDWDTDLPYALAPQIKIIYKWNGSDFEESGRIKDYTTKDIRRIRA